MADTKVYLPLQTVRRGKAGYKGKDVVVVDPATGQAIKGATKAAGKTASKPDKGDAGDGDQGGEG